MALRATGLGLHKAASAGIWDEFLTRSPLVRSLRVGYEGPPLQFTGTVRCRVRTEQNIALIRSTAAAVTIQPLVVIELQARGDKGWLVNVSPLGGAPCGPTNSPLLPVALWLKLRLTVIWERTLCDSVNINVHPTHPQPFATR